MILIQMKKFHQMTLKKLKNNEKIVDENHKIERKVVTRDEAKAFFKDDPYKLELIDAIPEDEKCDII